MSTSVHFDNFNHAGQQQLIDDLVTESIQIFGHEVYYLPRTIVKFDQLYKEDYLSSFESNHSIEMYINTQDGFGGEGDLMSKFGLEIRDSMSLSVSRRRFESELTGVTVTRPQEGDLIYFPLNGKLFDIKFVEHEPVFYQMGSLQFYNLSVELYEYSDEEIDTGLDVIDGIDDDLSLDQDREFQILVNGEPLQDSEGSRILINGVSTFVIEDQTDADNTFLQTGNNFVDFSESDPFSEGNW